MRSIRSRWLVGVVAIAAAVFGAAGTADAGDDAAAARQTAVVCAACHAVSDPSIDAPRLAGQAERYLARQLAAFKRGDRVSPLMSSVARQLSDADIDHLAAFWSAQPAGGSVAPPAAIAAINRSRMAFPRDFPDGFVLYLTSNIADLNTIRKTYINAIGFQAARANRPLPNGTVIIAVICNARVGADNRPVLDKAGGWVVDKIRAYSGMEMRAGWGNDIPALVRNASWNYSLFTADKRRNETSQAACLVCHKPQAAVSYLFSFNELQDRATAK